MQSSKYSSQLGLKIILVLNDFNTHLIKLVIIGKDTNNQRLLLKTVQN